MQRPALLLTLAFTISLAAACGGGDAATPPPPPPTPGELGDACGDGDECASGFCVDDVCCDAACADVCGSCSAAATGGSDGTCAPKLVDTPCRAATDTCDTTETCDGASLDCPTDGVEPTTSQACAPFACPGDGVACETTCATHADCAPGAMCDVATCVVAKRMFITSTTTTGSITSGALTGLAAADAICNSLAATANITGTYKAWMSSGAASAASRLTHFNGPYYRLNNGQPLLVATNWDDLVDGISVAIATDENGTIRGNEFVYTGTNGDGTASTATCVNWTSGSQNDNGTGGYSSSGTTAWTNDGTLTCQAAYRFYCVEQ